MLLSFKDSQVESLSDSASLVSYEFLEGDFILTGVAMDDFLVIYFYYYYEFLEALRGDLRR